MAKLKLEPRSLDVKCPVFLALPHCLIIIYLSFLRTNFAWPCGDTVSETDIAISSLELIIFKY